MKHPVHSVTDFEVVAPYTIKVVFKDATTGVINFLPKLRGEMYRPLRDLLFFNQARIDPVAGTLTWPNGADFDPADLRDWARGE